MSTYREVLSADGVRWELWEVYPTSTERRDDAESSATPTTGERRRRQAARIKLSADLRNGWLAMRSPAERRRVAPIPDGWRTRTDEELRELIDGADPAGRARRLIE